MKNISKYHLYHILIILLFSTLFPFSALAESERATLWRLSQAVYENLNSIRSRVDDHLIHNEDEIGVICLVMGHLEGNVSRLAVTIPYFDQAGQAAMERDKALRLNNGVINISGFCGEPNRYGHSEQKLIKGNYLGLQKELDELIPFAQDLKDSLYKGS